MSKKFFTKVSKLIIPMIIVSLLLLAPLVMGMTKADLIDKLGKVKGEVNTLSKKLSSKTIKLIGFSCGALEGAYFQFNISLNSYAAGMKDTSKASKLKDENRELGNALTALKNATKKRNVTQMRHYLKKMKEHITEIEKILNGIKLVAIKPVSIKPTGGTMQAVSAEVEINYFKKCVDPGTMASTRSSTSSNRLIVHEGRVVDMCWMFEACKALSVSATMGGQKIGNLGTRTSLGNSCYQYRGHRVKAFGEDESGPYKFKVTALRPGPKSTDEKTLNVTVKKLELTAQQPTLNNATREVSFYAKNTGDLDIPQNTAGILYEIYGIVRGPAIKIADGYVPKNHGVIRRGETALLGKATLDEGSMSYSRMQAKVAISGANVGESYKTFTLEYERGSFSIGKILIEAIVQSLISDVRINNYDASKRTGEVSSQEPFIHNDSWITVMGTENRFTPQRIALRYEIKGSVTGKTYKTYNFRAYINNVHLDGRAQLVLGRNSLGVRLTFDSSVSREIKGFIRESSTAYHDGHGPDIDVKELVVNMTIRPYITNDNKISFRDLRVVTNVRSEFAGGWNVIDSFKPDISRQVEGIIKDVVKDQIDTYLSGDTIKTWFESEMDKLIQMRGDVNRILSLTIGADGITINYM